LLSPKFMPGRLRAAGSLALACLLLFGIPRSSRRWRAMLGMLALLSFALGGMTACGGGGSGGRSSGGGGNPGTTLGSYTITITGTSGSLTETGTLALTVN
jgi:hypothetical protein